jgi:hypothetical protein
MKKKNLILLLLFLGIFTSYSQNITVKGKVSDPNGSTLPGANIAVKGTNELQQEETVPSQLELKKERY